MTTNLRKNSLPFNLSDISSLGPFSIKSERLDEYTSRDLYFPEGKEKPFLVVSKSTFELRTDRKLRALLVKKYESVMISRYFGSNGLEIVSIANQLKKDELKDLVLLSYNLTNSLQS